MRIMTLMNNDFIKIIPVDIHMDVHLCGFYDVFSWLHWMENALDINHTDMVYNLDKY